MPMKQSAVLTWVMVRGDDSNFSEFVIQPQSLHHLPGARPNPYACPDFRKPGRRFIYVDLDIGVLRESYCAGKAAYPASAGSTNEGHAWGWLSRHTRSRRST